MRGQDPSGQELDDRSSGRSGSYVDVAGKISGETALFHQPARRHRHVLKQDTGIETIDLYPSIVSSNFIEVTWHADDQLLQPV